MSLHASKVQACNMYLLVQTFIFLADLLTQFSCSIFFCVGSLSLNMFGDDDLVCDTSVDWIHRKQFHFDFPGCTAVDTINVSTIFNSPHDTFAQRFSFFSISSSYHFTSRFQIQFSIRPIKPRLHCILWKEKKNSPWNTVYIRVRWHEAKLLLEIVGRTNERARGSKTDTQNRFHS